MIVLNIHILSRCIWPIVSWAGLEVLLVGIIVAVLEIGPISKYLLMAACEPLLPGIDNVLVPLGLVGQKDANCFYVDAQFEVRNESDITEVTENSATIQIAAVLLAATSLLTNLLSQIVNRCAETSIEQRELEIGLSRKSAKKKKKLPSRVSD